MRFTAVGDILVQKRLPGEYEGFKTIEYYINRGEFKFLNLETTLNRGEFFASQYCGGSYLRMEPEVLEDVKKYGFNVLSACNNHSMDFSHAGLLNTKREIEKSGLLQAGIGKNLSEAAAPVYLDTLSGRVALIGVTSSFNAAARAGEQTRRLPGRPGVNGMRYDEIYGVAKEDIDKLQEIAEKANVNGRNNIRRSEGYLEEVPQGLFDFKELHFAESEKIGRMSYLDEDDMRRIEKNIYDAKLQADYIVISIHTHQVRNGIKDESDFFIEEFAHRCIDLGAHAIIGHGPHILRGIEIYKGCPIFYSLGNFVFHNENIPYAPEEFYAKYNLDSTRTMHELFIKRSNNFTRGLQLCEDAFISVVPYWEMTDGKLDYLELFPVELGYGKKRSANGWPRFDEEGKALKKLQKLSEKYNVNIAIKNGRGVIEL